MEKWNSDTLKRVDDYKRQHNVGTTIALEKLGLSQASYYGYRSRSGIAGKAKVTPKRKYTRRAQEPVTLELAAPNQTNRIVIMVATRDNFKSILDGVL